MEDKMTALKYFSIFLIALIVIGCEQPTVELNDDNYEPKIVMEGYLFPGQPVQNIKITRNIPLNTTIDRSALILDDADVRLTDLSADKTYTLTFDDSAKAYAYRGGDLIIEHGKSYRLAVNASFAGNDLWAASTTTVPQAGFQIIEEGCTDSIAYYAVDGFGHIQKPQVQFQRSPGTDFYMFSIVAVDAVVDDFIYPPANPYVKSDWDEDDVKENFYDLRYSDDGLINTPLDGGSMNYGIEWMHIMFYGRHRIIAYAGDINMRNYILTYKRVMEMDGNLHEPRFNIDGDGIGVFGSAIADTVYFDVLK